MTGKLLRQDFANDTVTAQFFKFFQIIEEDKFLQAIIAEIDLSASGDVVIYPQIGKQYFILGDLEDLEYKILKMKIFYKNILPVKGWNFCEKVNLKFKDQIITE
jgi:cell division protein FtsQ